MKKLFTIIAVASMMLTSVFGFTSCQKDEMPAPAPQQTQQPAVTVTTSSSYTERPAASNSTGSKIVKMDVNGESVSLDKKIDTSYAVGEWTATVNDTVYTLVVSNNAAKNEYDTEYRATLKVCDKSYDGTYTAVSFMYTGRFDSDEQADDGFGKTMLDYISVNKSTLSEITVKFLVIDERTVAEDVKFVKK